MQERSGEFFEDKEMASNVKRYEAMMKSGVFTYFDVEEIENVVNFYIDNNQLEKAHNACVSGLSIHPTSQELKLKNAQLYVGRGMASEALEWLGKVKELSGASFEYFLTKGMARVLQNKLDKAETLFNKALKMAPLSEAEELLYNIGDALENSGAFSLAIQYYEWGIVGNPKNEEFYFRLGFSCDRAGDYEKSIAYYQKYLDFNPFAENVWYNLGIIYNRIEEYDKAIDAYEYSYALNSDYQDALFNKANAYANAEKHIEAIKTYTEYIENNPKSLSAKYYIGECYLQLKEYNLAQNCFDEILDEDAQFAEAYYGKAMVFDDLKDYDTAIKYYLMAVKVDEEITDAWFSLGNLYVKLNKLNEAVNAFNKAVSINKFDIEAWLLNAETYCTLNECEKSIGLLIEAYDYLPDSPDIVYALAAYYYRSGSTLMGLQWFKKAIEMDDNTELFFKIFPDGKTNNDILLIINKIEQS